MNQQIRLRFDTVEEAESYARRSGIYQIEPVQDRSTKKVSYPDNFRHDRKFLDY